MSHRSNRTIALTTLGCKVNQSDSDEWLRQFVARGYDIVDFNAVADAYVVNTCSVTHVADRKSRQLLRHARRQNPAALVVATGCYASVAPEEVARMVEVDLVIGDQGKPRLVETVHQALEGAEEQPLETLTGPLRAFGPRHRGFVKVSDGCNKFCAFCIVPYARGRTRSVESNAVVGTIDALVADGYREVVLTAVHIGNYGFDLTPPTTLGALIDRALAETAVERLRISSIEPEDFDDRLLTRWSDPRLCRHFHLALDSGCDATLERMRRRYRASEYRSLVRRIRAAIPEVAITTDVMVGFPGETDQEFEVSYQFVAEQEFALIHVFPYSPRRRTTASKLPGSVDPETRQRRTDQMLTLARESASHFRQRFVGRTVSVLFEQPAPVRDGPPAWEGLTDNYLRVRAPSERDLANSILSVCLDGVEDDALVGHLVGPPSDPATRLACRVELTSASR
ncbi:MAG: tRNA (N(6)-L-threonylcarbamoyladenosine(37)-C(2))-methylthiotransferase MtaB [Chloroflexota bacterium]